MALLIRVGENRARKSSKPGFFEVTGLEALNYSIMSNSAKKFLKQKFTAVSVCRFKRDIA